MEIHSMKYLILLVFLVGCSFSHNFDDIKADGNIKIGYDVDQIRELCELAHPIEDYETETVRLKDVVQCTLDNLLTLGLDIDQEALDELRDILDDNTEETP